MAKTRVQKEESVVDYAGKLSRSRSVVFADYQGLTMAQLSQLRNKLSEQEAEFTVTKNTLLKRAMESTDYRLPTTAEDSGQKTEDIFQGPTATLFSFGDEIAPIKILVKALKDAQKGQIKGGILDLRFLDSYSVNKLATLPGKQELRAQVVGTIAAPLFGMVNVLQGNLRNLVYALDQIRIKKGGE